MGCEPILPDIQPVTIDTILTEYWADIKNEKIGLNFVTCEQSLMVMTTTLLLVFPHSRSNFVITRRFFPASVARLYLNFLLVLYEISL